MGMSQPELGAALGVRSSFVCDLEQGYRRISPDRIPLLAKTIQVEEKALYKALDVTNTRLIRGFGVLLKEGRTAVGMSQPELGSALGVTGSFICDLEKSYRRIHLDKIPLLAKAIRVEEEILYKALIVQYGYCALPLVETEEHLTLAAALIKRWKSLPKTKCVELRNLLEKGKQK